MKDSRERSDMIRRLEEFAGKKLNYPREIEELISLAGKDDQTDVFQKLLFEAKALVQTRKVSEKIGPGSVGFDKLAAEIQASQDRCAQLLEQYLNRASDEVRGRLVGEFLSPLSNYEESFLKFMSDLSWLKNWQLDGNPIPADFSNHGESKAQPKTAVASNPYASESASGLRRIHRSALLGSFLWVLFLFLDPPVTVLGWTLSLGILVFLLYIMIQAQVIMRNQNQS